MIKFDDDDNLINYNINDYLDEYQKIYNGMQNKDILGYEYLGWIDNTLNIDDSLVDKIKTHVKQLQAKAKNMIVIGIGGSYLGAKAVSSAMKNQLLENEYNLIFAGYNMSSDYLAQLVEFCWKNDFVVNVISKSGTTLEPALTFRIIKNILLEKYGPTSLDERLVITTDKEDGSLKEYADNNGLETYVVPNDIGGRFSVFSSVGLIPLAFINIDIDKFLKGAQHAARDNFKEDENNAFRYAINRFLQYESGKKIEAFITYEPRLEYLDEWLKQLFAESEGKNNKGLFPVGMLFSTDLHSLGQYIQDGQKIIFETIIKIKKPLQDLELPFDEVNEDRINNLREHTINDINLLTLEGVRNAHVMGEVPNLVIEIEKIDEYNLGYLMSFFMYACAYSAYFLKVNPFNQPGVEIYKQEIYKVF